MAMTPSKSGNGLYRPLADINVTPLVDVMLVLLIIFMVTAPMLASGMKVNLPQAKQANGAVGRVGVLLNIGPSGAISSHSIVNSSGNAVLDAAANQVAAASHPRDASPCLVLAPTS